VHTVGIDGNDDELGAGAAAPIANPE